MKDNDTTEQGCRMLAIRVKGEASPGFAGP